MSNAVNETLKTDYEHAVVVSGLAPERAARLVEHVVSRDAMLQQPPTPPAVVRLAAALLAAQPAGLSSPTALAEAEEIAKTPGLGEALLAIQQSLTTLAGFDQSRDALAARLYRDGLQAEAARRILRHLVAEAQRLLERIQPM